MKANWFVVLLLACSHSWSETTTPYSYQLSESQLERSKSEALLGSAQAANKIVNHFWMRGIPDRDQTTYWATIGAENGDVESKFRLWQTLHRSDSSVDQRRALFWLRRAAQEGYSAAQAMLDDCDRWPDPPGTDAESLCFGSSADD